MTEPIKCIAADPPWLERGGGKSKRGADRHYPLMKTEDIIIAMRIALGMFPAQRELFGLPSARFKIAKDAHLWLWITDNFLEDGLLVMRKLGFRYIRTMVWVKINPVFSVKEPESYDTVCELVRDHLQIGLGQYLRGSHELCLFGVRGKAMVPEPQNRPLSVISAPRTEHSRKPPEAFEVFERVSPGPRLEMFARRPRDGWSVWGNEV